MSVGDTFNSGGLVVAQEKVNGECLATCEAPYTGGVSHTMRLDYQGPIVFPGGNTCADGIALSNIGGPGKGEKFYFCRGFGWVGFSRAEEGSLNYPITNLEGEASPGIAPLVVEDDSPDPWHGKPFRPE